MSIEDARTVRQHRAEVVAGLRNQSLWLEDVLRDPPQGIDGCPIGKLVRAARHVGETRRREILNLCKIDSEVKVMHLSEFQRERIIMQLPQAARRPR